MEMPILKEKRITLRPFTLNDAPRVQMLAGNYKIAETTATIPHPYKDGMAELWIETHVQDWEDKNSLTLAIQENKSNLLIGCIGLIFKKLHKRAELAYWIGEPYWNNGYCTEAAFVLISYAFENLDLNKINAHHMSKNPTSGKVMQKLGMKLEGEFKKHFLRFDEFQDMIAYGLLKSEFRSKV